MIANKLKHFNSDEMLELAHQKYIELRLQHYQEYYETVWLKWEPIFRDYLNGMTANEIIDKYSEAGRQKVYLLIKILNLPRADIITLRRLAKRIKPKQLQIVNVCACFACHWVRQRRAKAKQGLIQL